MPRSAKRKVKRAPTGRHEIVRAFTEREWYELPDWAVDWLSRSVWWLVFGLVILLVPIALLAIVLAMNSLPLNYLGIASSSTGLGLTAVFFMAKFILLALAVRPLRRAQIRGWHLVIAAATVNCTENILAHQYIFATLLLGITIYLYTQVRHRFS